MFRNQSRAIPESKGEGGLRHGQVFATLFQVRHRETKNHPHVLTTIGDNPSPSFAESLNIHIAVGRNSRRD